MIVIRFLHLSLLSSTNVSIDQARHLMGHDTGIDIELCAACSRLGLTSLSDKFEASLSVSLSLESFIRICTYASLNNRHTILQLCYIWIKRYEQLKEYHWIEKE